jgi:hypothetical protein
MFNMASAETNVGIEDFVPGELDALIAEGERDIANGDVMEADEAFKLLRRINDRRRESIRGNRPEPS